MKTTLDFKKMKAEKEAVVMLTAYDAPSAKLSQEGGVDCLLVGDSLGMVVLGYDSTVPVTLDDMIHHTKAVRRGAPDTFTITDMPFLTYHSSLAETIHNARLLIQAGGAQAVKMEGSGKVLEYTAELVRGGVPVVSHLGLTPQTVGVTGGYKVQGKESAEAEQLIKDAVEAEKAGACMLVLECVPEQLAKKVSQLLSIPVIGIGAGRYTDGQVLVYHDLTGYHTGHLPKFVKQYADISSSVKDAVATYRNDVKSSLFPERKHVFQPADDSNADGLYGGGATHD